MDGGHDLKLKNTLKSFHDNSHRLGRFNRKLIIEIQFCMKSNNEIMYFLA